MKDTEQELIKAAVRVYRQRNNVEAEFFKTDATCKCTWCVAKRKFVAACKAYLEQKRAAA